MMDAKGCRDDDDDPYLNLLWISVGSWRLNICQTSGKCDARTALAEYASPLAAAFFLPFSGYLLILMGLRDQPTKLFNLLYIVSCLSAAFTVTGGTVVSVVKMTPAN